MKNMIDCKNGCISLIWEKKKFVDHILQMNMYVMYGMVMSIPISKL
jgi:hypothetical protein